MSPELAFKMSEANRSRIERQQSSFRGVVGSTRSTGRNQAIAFGLATSRAFSSVGRYLAGVKLDERDADDLLLIRRTLTRAADALRYPNDGAIPRAERRDLVPVGLAMTAVPDIDPSHRSQSADFLSRIADGLQKIVENETPSDAQEIMDYLQGLMRRAQQDSASSGEVLRRALL